MTLKTRLQDVERRAAARPSDVESMTTAELEQAIIEIVGYLPDTEELRRLVLALEEAEQ